MTEETLVYRTPHYEGPQYLDATPSRECKKYHENSYVQINKNGKRILRKIPTKGKVNND